MGHESPLVRQWILLKTLGARRYGSTLQEMAQELGVCEKTIRRDLETFERAGFPLEEETCEHGRKKWRLDPAKYQAGLAFSFDEALALYLARHLMQPLAGTPFGEAARGAFKKIRAALGDAALKYAERFAGLFHQTVVGASSYADKAELIDRLLVGMEDRRAVFITYRSQRATEPVTYDCYPYGLAYHRGSLYLVGWSPNHEEIRHWKVDRIEAVDLTPVHFAWPEGFTLRDHFANSFGVYHGCGDFQVKIRFSPDVARYVKEKRWHESQKLIPQPDGSLAAEFRLGSTEEIKSWVLSFGKEAEVVEPEELRREVMEDLRRLSESYARKGKNLSRMPKMSGRRSEGRPSPASGERVAKNEPGEGRGNGQETERLS